MEKAFKVIIPTLRALRQYQSRSPATLLSNTRYLQCRFLAANSSPLSSSVGGNLEESVAVSTDVFSALRSSHTSEEILAVVQANRLTGDQASLALSSLKNSNLLSSRKADLSSDERFVMLLDTVGDQVKDLTPESLVSSLVSILKLDNRDVPTVQLLESECRRRLRAMGIRHLTHLVCNSYLLSKGLAQEARAVLELRWKELNNPLLLKRLLKTSLQLSPTFTERLEDKTLEMMDKFSFHDLVEIAGYFTSSRRIATLVMHAITYQAEEHRGQWRMWELLKLVGYMGYSRYYNNLFLKDVAAFCKEELSNCSPQEISEIVRSFGMLRMPEPELFDALMTHLQGHLADFSISELQTIVSGLSMVNIKPPTPLVKRLVFEFDTLRFTEQIEVCLALAVFNASSDDKIRKLFEMTEAVNDIMESDTPWHAATRLKLLQLNAHAKTECPGYTGPYLSEEVTRYPKVREFQRSNLQKDVTSKLETVLGDRKFLMTSVRLDSGYIIDAEIAVDDDKSPYSTTDYNISASSWGNSQLRKDLPQDVTRVAVIVNGPACYMYNSPELTGRRQMMVRQLQALGYLLVQVPFQEWSSMKSDNTKIEYLQKKLEGVIKLS